MKNNEKVNIFTARKLDKATRETRKSLARGIKQINPGLIYKTEEQMQAGAFDLYYASATDGAMIGYATIMSDEGTHSCHLNKIHTAEKYKGQGIATALLDQLMADFKKISLDDANHETDGSKQGMIALYNKLGFKKIGGDRYEWTKAK